MSIPDLNTAVELAVHVVAYCSFLSAALTPLEKWATDNFPGSGFAKAVTAAVDLVSKYGALNFRTKPREQWTDEQRKSQSGVKP